MFAVLGLLVVVSLSLFVTRVATVALVHTGLSRESARFQARSAFTGVGFTTTESEAVVDHPVRRRILMALMLIGNAGIVTVVSSLILTVLSIDRSASSNLWLVGVLLGGLALLLVVGTNRWLDRRLSRVITWSLDRFTDLDAKDYGELLQLNGEYRVVELLVEPEDWVAGRRLADAQLREEGLNVLAIVRPDGEYLGTPEGETSIGAGDTLVLYGRGPDVARLDVRRRGREGDREHDRATGEQDLRERATRDALEGAAAS